MDKKLGILRLKQKNMELIGDYLVADSNESVNLKHKNKEARVKSSTTDDRKEALKKFSQALSNLWEALDGVKEALAFNGDSK